MTQALTESVYASPDTGRAHLAALLGTLAGDCISFAVAMQDMESSASPTGFTRVAEISVREAMPVTVSALIEWANVHVGARLDLGYTTVGALTLVYRWQCEEDA